VIAIARPPDVQHSANHMQGAPKAGPFRRPVPVPCLSSCLPAFLIINSHASYSEVSIVSRFLPLPQLKPAVGPLWGRPQGRARDSQTLLRQTMVCIDGTHTRFCRSVRTFTAFRPCWNRAQPERPHGSTTACQHDTCKGFRVAGVGHGGVAGGHATWPANPLVGPVSRGRSSGGHAAVKCTKPGYTSG